MDHFTIQSLYNMLYTKYIYDSTDSTYRDVAIDILSDIAEVYERELALFDEELNDRFLAEEANDG